MTNSSSRTKSLALASLVLGFLGILVPIIGAVGTRVDLWGYTIGLFMTPAGLLLALAGLLIGVRAMLRLRKLGERLVLAAHGAGLSLLVVLYFGSLMITVFSVPPIHNVSTDIEDPPQFTHAQSLRTEHENSLDYDIEAIGEIQREGYPEVKPLVMELAPDEMFGRVKRVLLDMGMEVTKEDPAQGEMEAVATTFWFAFKDDLVVRLREVEGGTRMDLRSVSRVGVVDIGANADRIMEVIKRVEEAS